jgi:hypothetical protein
MPPDDQRAALGALSDDARAHLQAAAAPAPLRAVPDVAAMGDTDKLLKAREYAQEHLAPDVRAQVAGLFTPQSIAMMAAFGSRCSARRSVAVRAVAARTRVRRPTDSMGLPYPERQARSLIR